MIRLIGLALLLLSLAAYGNNREPTNRSGIEEGAELHLIKQLRRYVLVTEAKVRKELTDETYSQVLLGWYYRLTRHFRIGFFGQAEQGLRWDADWGRRDGRWDWNRSDNRWDYSSVFDATYVDLVNSRTTYEFKTRLIYYHSRDALQLRLRPGLRHFIIQEGKPVWQLYTAAEAYAPLNYGEGPLYEFWLYGGALYQLSPRLALGPLLSLRRRWFRSYDGFEDRTGEKFETTFTSIGAGLTAVYHW